jgi:L-aspartate oxidase
MKHTLVTDYLIIGSGIAGLSLALKAAKFGKVIIITKVSEDETNTKYAQGGVAAVINEKDSFSKHIEDTLIAGDGLCNIDIVSMVIENGPKRIQEIIDMGAHFDKDPNGNYDLAKEGGHSEYRVLHYQDITGLEIERSLLVKVHEEPNITLFTHFLSLELLTQHHLGIGVNKSTSDITCFGIFALDIRSGEVEKILSKVTVMATGGAGQIYTATTNPVIATGDGIAMVYRAKGKIRNMEFIQFHPTSLHHPGDSPSFLISEAVRGAGGILKTLDGEEFMQQYDSRRSLAPRDIVARAINSEMIKSGKDFVYLDVRHLDKKELLKHFPNIYAKCLSIGIDMSRDMIPVVPAAHYTCGGIMVDKQGQSTIKNLYACGECASTGLHGANRLASNSLLEALVFADCIFEATRDRFSQIEIQEGLPDWDAGGLNVMNEDILVSHNVREMQRIMSDYVGIVRSDFRLDRALRRMHLLYDETEAFYKATKLSPALCELRNLIQVSYLVIKSALLRKESRGLHFSIDYPEHNDFEVKDTIF